MKKINLLHGSDKFMQVTSVDINRNCAKVWHKNKLDNIPFQPFIWIKDKRDLNRLKVNVQIKSLVGQGYKYLALLPDIKSFWNARKYLMEMQKPFVAILDLQQQFLIQNGITLFKGMKYIDLKRMQFDIETKKGLSIVDNEILCISVKCREEEHVFHGKESDILHNFFNYIKKINPDVLEGYNIELFDLPIIENRANHYGIKFPFYSYNMRIKTGDSGWTLIKKYFYKGKHVIDLYHTAKRYNVINRVFDSYKLDNVIESLNLSRKNRVHIDAANIVKIWSENKDKVIQYAIDDVRDVDLLSKQMLPEEFYQAKMCPISYDKMCITGIGNKINSFFFRYYYHNNYAIPEKEERREFEGALVLKEGHGIYKHVIKFDVSSMYPSIMVANKTCPKSDKLEVFPKLLKELKSMRFQIKDKAKTVEGAVKDQLDGMQKAYKVLINGMYGVQGSQASPWNDYDNAEFITAEGRRILKLMIETFKKMGFIVLGSDTDGVFVTREEWQ